MNLSPEQYNRRVMTGVVIASGLFVAAYIQLSFVGRSGTPPKRPESTQSQSFDPPTPSPDSLHEFCSVQVVRIQFLEQTRKGFIHRLTYSFTNGSNQTLTEANGYVQFSQRVGGWGPASINFMEGKPSGIAPGAVVYGEFDALLNYRAGSVPSGELTSEVTYAYP